MKTTWLSVIVVVVVTVGVGTASATQILMSTDGYYTNNVQKAGALGHVVSTASLDQINTMTAEALAVYDAVFVSPGFGTTGYANLRSAVVDGGSLQLYVATGGTLVLNVAGNFGYQDDIAPGGVDYARQGLHDEEFLTRPGHRMITGEGFGGETLVQSDFSDWGRTDHGILANFAADASVILSNTDGPVLIEYYVDLGNVLVSTLTVGWAIGGEARGKVQDNMIQYAVSEVPEPATICFIGLGAVAALRRKRRTD